MAEVTTVQQRLEKIAEEKLQNDIREINNFISKKGFRKVLDSFHIRLEEGGTITVDSLFNGYSSNVIYKRASEILLPDMINTEVKAFMAKVDNLSEQIDELRGSIGGEY